ncbi:hypothetical protein B0H11DRAFT_1909109 [Mycena galericulata]|nr:hypothetical protein B0H11DRAFT_1909109 [Mycena galericulata]
MPRIAMLTANVSSLFKKLPAGVDEGNLDRRVRRIDVQRLRLRGLRRPARPQRRDQMLPDFRRLQLRRLPRMHGLLRNRGVENARLLPTHLHQTVFKKIIVLGPPPGTGIRRLNANVGNASAYSVSSWIVPNVNCRASVPTTILRLKTTVLQGSVRDGSGSVCSAQTANL